MTVKAFLEELLEGNGRTKGGYYREGAVPAQQEGHLELTLSHSTKPGIKLAIEEGLQAAVIVTVYFPQKRSKRYANAQEAAEAIMNL